MKKESSKRQPKSVVTPKKGSGHKAAALPAGARRLLAKGATKKRPMTSPSQPHSKTYGR